MRLDRLARAEFSPIFARMMLAYQRTIPDGDLGPTVDVYYGVVQRFASTIVERAVADLIEHPTRFFPRAGDLAGKCRDLEGEEMRRHGAQHHATEHDDRCPHCRAAIFYAGYELGNGNVVGRRRCDCLPQGRGWSTERGQAWRETGPQDYAAAKEELRRILHPKKSRSQMETVAAVLGDHGDSWEATDEEWERAIDTKRDGFRTAAQQGDRE